MEIIYRLIKGLKLTHAELDNNFRYLDQRITTYHPEGQSSPIRHSDLNFTEVVLTPDSPIAVDAGPILNLNVDTNSGAWTEPPFLNGLVLRGELQDGSFGFIRNVSSNAITLNHLSDSTDVQFRINTNSDLILGANSIAYMVYSKKSNVLNVVAFDTSPNVPKQVNSEVYVLQESDIGNSQIYIKLAHDPLVNEFVNVYCNGILLNPSGIIVDERLLMIDVNNVDYSFKVGMKITVNYKY